MLLLLDAPGVGPRRLLDLLATHGSAYDVHRWLTTPTAGGNDRLLDFLSGTKIDYYLGCVEATYELGGNFKLWSDDDYPSNLLRWKGRPPVLFYKGDMSRLGERSLALVGRVDPTETGRDSARRFARKCVEHGITVISGLAKGIDGASHTAALEDPPGYTYAVVGHGLDHAYPKENQKLYAEIPTRGAIISQFRTGFGPQKWTFPARNEVMCTLALGTVIIEGKTGCGSIIQADFSFKHSRPVFLLAKNLATQDAGWARELVERGAHVVERFDQVLEVMNQITDSDAWRSSVQEVLFYMEPLAGRIESDEDAAISIDGRGNEKLAAVFDLDGVVVDSRAATAAAIAEIASAHTGRLIEPSEVVVAGAPHKALESLGVQDAYRVYRAKYNAAFLKHANRMKAFDGTVSRLQALRDSGIRIGVVTAQPRQRALAMVPQEVRKLFDEFLCYNETGGKKEVGIAECLGRFGVEKSRAVYVGDTPSDLQAARRAGVRCAGALWGFSDEAELRRWPHDVLLDRWSEITPEFVRMIVA